MPLFNQKAQTGMALADDVDISNFLNPDQVKYVDARKALRNSDIYSLIYQLSSDLADGELKADASRAQGILNNPTTTSNSHAFWQSMYAQLLLGGEAFAYRWRNKNGLDLSWEYLRPSQVQPFLLEDGSGLIYNISFDEPKYGLMEAVPQNNVIHMRLLSRNGGKTGISPLMALSDELQIKEQSNKLTLSALARSIMAPGVLKIQHGGLLSEKDKASRSRKFVKQTQNSSNGPIVLDDLEDYTPLEVQSNVAQLLDQANWTGQQIAKVYGVSDSVINGTGDQQSSVQMMNSDYTKSLSRFAKSITGELNNKLNAHVELDLRPSVDPLGDDYASQIATMRRFGVLGTNQASWSLKQAGYLPDNLPEPTEPVEPMKGGDKDDEDQG